LGSKVSHSELPKDVVQNLKHEGVEVEAQLRMPHDELPKDVRADYGVVIKSCRIGSYIIYMLKPNRHDLKHEVFGLKGVT
jgi:hypothetical protein